MKIFIGTSGWSYQHWKNRFYPLSLSSYEWLEFYSSRFSTVEVNMTFYRWPSEKLFLSWYKRTPKNFVFTLKAPKQITHIKKLQKVKNTLKQFYKLAFLLKEKLGCLLFQLPPSFNFNLENVKRIKYFLNQINEMKHVIEFRHKSWWNSKVYEILRDKASFCIVSAPKLPKDFVLTNKICYIRFHGREWYHYSYRKKELEEWAKKIKKRKVKESYIYFNNDANAYAVKNALVLKKILELEY